MIFKYDDPEQKVSYEMVVNKQNCHKANPSVLFDAELKVQEENAEVVLVNFNAESHNFMEAVEKMTNNIRMLSTCILPVEVATIAARDFYLATA